MGVGPSPLLTQCLLYSAIIIHFEKKYNLIKECKSRQFTQRLRCKASGSHSNQTSCPSWKHNG